MADGVHLRVAELMAAGGHLRAAELMAAASAALSAAVDAVDAVDDPSEAAGLRTATRGRLVIASATADGARRLFVREAGLPSTGPDHDSRKLLAAAGLALQAERPREALEFVTDACKMCGNLSNVERSVFIDASKGSIGRLLASVNSVGTKFRQDTTENELRMLYAYKVRIQDELLQTCSSVMEVIENYLLPNSTGESTVVFYRMKGLCLGVMSKINSTSPMEKMKAFSAYVLAIAEAERSLCVSHPERLYATLDVVKFLHDHMDKPEWAWQIARKTLDDVELSLSGSRMSTLPDQSLSVLNQIGEEVIALSKEVADFQDLFGPYIPARSSHCLKKRKIEGRKCSSTGADSAILALPSSYIHPVIDYHEEGEDGNILHPEGNLQNDPEQEGNVEDGNILHPEDDFQNDPEQEGNGEDGNILHPEDNLQNDPEQEGAESEQNAYLVHGVNQTNSHPEGHEAEDEALDTGDAQSSVRFLSKVNSYLKSFF